MQNSRTKKKELLFLANDDNETAFNKGVEQLELNLKDFHNIIAKLARMVEQIGTLEDNSKLRTKLSKTKDQGFALAKTINISLIELDKHMDGDPMALVKPQASKKKLETDYKRMLNKFEKVCNRIQIQTLAHVLEPEDEEANKANSMKQQLINEEEEAKKRKAVNHDGDEHLLLHDIDPKLKLVNKDQAALLASQEEARHIQEIEQEADEVAEILSTINTTVQDQNVELQKASDNIVDAGHKVEQGKGELKKAAAMATVGSALIGATIGAVVLGPIGAGIGAAAAASLSIGTGIGVGVGVVSGGSLGAAVSYLVTKKAAKKAVELPKEEKDVKK